MDTAAALTSQIKSCTLCADRFAATATGHTPRPVAWFGAKARILIAGQAPGARVHDSGKPFTDPSGDRLRDWMGIDRDVFYDRSKLAILPMAFCFPGYDAKGSDLPPPKVCATTWREAALEEVGDVPLICPIGGYAQTWHLGRNKGVTDVVSRWGEFAPNIFPLPHPSWRNNTWLKKNPWFEGEALPVLRAAIAQRL